MRQARRIIKKFKEDGVQGIKHGNTGRIPYNKTNPEFEMEILGLLKGKYYDFNLTHFKEMIEVHEGITPGKNIIHRIARKHGLVKRAKKKPHPRAYKPRPRMPQEGMLVQFDGSEHIWFGSFESDLIGGIDDATGRVLDAEFFIGETSLNCMKVMTDIINSNGIPHAFYLDKAAAFGKDDRDQTTTQVGRALSDLGSNMILANSAQAKGRIERLWDTFQDRLIAEMRLYDIKTIPQANKFLKEDFIPRYNERFSVVPRSKELAYMPLNQNIDNIMCVKERRKVSNGNVFSWHGVQYLLDSTRSYKFRTINEIFQGNPLVRPVDPISFERSQSTVNRLG